MSVLSLLTGRSGDADHLATSVVTGGGSGIGRGFCLELARRGGSVLVADVDDAAAKETVRLVGLAGGRGRAAHCDVADPDDVETLARTAQEWFGETPGLVINNAGIGIGGQAVGDDLMSDWERTLAVNLWGVIHGCRTFAPKMRAAGRGGIINIASAASFGAAPRMAAYNVSKAGVLALSETMAAELSGTGVTVTVVCPTFVKTNIIHADAIDAAFLAMGEKAMARFGWAPEKVAQVCLSAHSRGRLHVLPQLDSRAMWAAKRLAPATFTRVIGRLARYAPESVGPGVRAISPTPGATKPAAVAPTTANASTSKPSPAKPPTAKPAAKPVAAKPVSAESAR